MIVPGSANLLLAGADEGYQISRSLRFNSADSAYLNRTPASASNRQTWTWSGWVKRGTLGVTQWLFDADNGSTDSTEFNFAIGSGNTLSIGGSLTTWRVTTQLFRDPAAWYHIVLAIDTTQATANNRIRLYVNGSEVTAFSTLNNPTQNLDLAVNQAIAHYIGIRTGLTSPLDGYLTEINFIDGQALTPSSFGQTNAQTGVWEPKKYTGTYGTNGFYLNFSDNSGTTSTTLGKDSSGNANNWTPNNFSVTAGAGNDSLVDTPTPYGSEDGLGGTVRGNYATLNPLDKDVGNTTANGNLDVTTSTTGQGFQRATMFVSSGKWYWEITLTSASGNSSIGIAGPATTTSTSNYIGATADSYGYVATNGNKYNNNSNAAYGATYTTNDVIGVALDMDAGTLVFYKNGVSQGTAYSSLSGSFAPALSDVSNTLASTFTANFGQRPFAYTAPSGFKALCTTNLPTPTIGATSTTQANKYFDVALWTGTGSAYTVTGINFQPDFAWNKDRTAANSHTLYDAVRGVQKEIISNSTNAETTETNGLTAFNSNGVTYGIRQSQLNNNQVTWLWNGGGSNATNTSGTITSTVRANTTAGFSIVTYTGTGANATVGHGLGVAPSMIIVKNRDTAATDWKVYHSSLTSASYAVELNTTAAQGSSATYWNSTAPTSTVFSVGTSLTVNENTKKMVAYVFAPTAGYSAFGSYTGNGSTDGPFVFTGFRPRYILIKRIDTGDSWAIKDTAREPYNVDDSVLKAETSDAETTSTFWHIDALSNGFKLRNLGSTFNNNGGTYIYMALAENPFKYSLAR